MYKKLSYETKLREKGHRFIAGVDEVGMSPFAGGFVVCALILDLDKPYILQIDDSKKLNKKKRYKLETIIKERAISYKLIHVPVNAINSAYKKVKGVSGSFRKLHLEAMRHAVHSLEVRPTIVLVDHYHIPDLNIPQIAIEKGDSKSASIAGASILAKCFREQEMIHLAEKTPGYEHWASTFGTWSIREIIALHTLGPTKYHRIDFIENALKCKSGALRKNKNGEYYLDSKVTPIQKQQYIEVAREYGLKLKGATGSKRE